jgi:hypothetical protein
MQKFVKNAKKPKVAAIMATEVFFLPHAKNTPKPPEPKIMIMGTRL